MIRVERSGADDLARVCVGRRRLPLMAEAQAFKIAMALKRNAEIREEEHE